MGCGAPLPIEHMFDTVKQVGSPGGAARQLEADPAREAGRRTQLGALSVLAARGTAPVPAAARLLDAPAPLASLLPEGGLRRGSTVAVGMGPAPGSVSLATSLLAPASAAGAWCAVVAFPDLGLVAAAESGMVLERLALVPRPGEQWAVVVAALLESIDIVVVRPPARVRVGDARRLMARARERAAVLMVLDGSGGLGRWPEGADVRLEVTGSRWAGLGVGHGHLQEREVEVTVTGRRGATRPRSTRVRLVPGAPMVAAGDGGPPVAGGEVGQGSAAGPARVPAAGPARVPAALAPPGRMPASPAAVVAAKAG